MRTIVWNADDFGLTPGVNAAVEGAHRHGILTSASVLVNMPAFDSAVEIARRNPRLEVGLHLCLTSGQSVLPPAEVPLLVNERGALRHTFFGLWRGLRGRRGEELLRQIRLELAAQAQRVLATGLHLTHVDSHQHVHMLPGIFAVAANLARQHAWRLRVSHEPFAWRSLTSSSPLVAAMGQARRWLLAELAVRAPQGGRTLARSERCYGIAASGRLTLARLRGLVKNLPPGVSEIICHPALPGEVNGQAMSAADARFASSPFRQCEYEALLADELREELANRELFRAPNSHAPRMATT